MVQGIVIVGGSTLLAVAGLLAVVRWVPPDLRAADQDTKAAFLSLAGVAYAILLAFVTVAVWTDFTAAGKLSEEEVTRLGNLMRDAQPFPEETREEMHEAVVAYVHSVINREWRTMADGDLDPLTRTRYEAIWRLWYDYTPRGATETAFYAESITRLNDVAVNRRQRVNASESSVPLALWLLLIIGFVITMAFTFQFKMAHLSMHVVSVGATALLTGFVLFLIFALQKPFAGDVSISTAPWENFIETYEDRLRSIVIKTHLAPLNARGESTGEVLSASTIGDTAFCAGGKFIDGPVEAPRRSVLRSFRCPGGTLTITFTSTPPGVKQSSDWKVVKGLGRFEGLSGEGRMRGVLESRRGEGRETFTGTVIQ